MIITDTRGLDAAIALTKRIAEDSTTGFVRMDFDTALGFIALWASNTKIIGVMLDGKQTSLTRLRLGFKTYALMESVYL